MKRVNSITRQRLMELLSYDKGSGIFVWRVKTNQRIVIGNPAGSIHCAGYIRIRIDDHQYLAHRLAWLYVYGEWPKNHIDHINGIRSDNRICNLRDSTNLENAQNRRAANSNNKLGLMGVSKHGKKYLAQIRVDGEIRRLGFFDDPEKAKLAYVEAKRMFHPACTI